MPVVPSRQPGQVQTQAIAGPVGQVRAGASAFGGGRANELVSKGTQGLIGQVNAIKQAELQKANEIYVINAERRASEAARTIRNEAKAKKGKSAFGASDIAASDFDAFGADLASEATNPDQALAVKKILSDRKLRLGEAVESHSLREIEAYKSNEIDASIVNKGNEAVEGFQNVIDTFKDKNMDQSKLSAAIAQDAAEKMVDYRALNLMKTEGMGPEAVEAFMLIRTTEFHAGIVDSMIKNERGDLAAEYIENNKDEIDAVTRQNMLRSVERVSSMTNAQSFTDAVVASGLNVGDAIKKARKEFSGAQEEETVNHIKTRYSEQATAKAIETGRNIESLNNKISKSVLDGTASSTSILQDINRSNLSDGDKLETQTKWMKQIQSGTDRKLKRQMDSNKYKIISDLDEIYYKDPDAFLRLVNKKSLGRRKVRRAVSRFVGATISPHAFSIDPEEEDIPNPHYLPSLQATIGDAAYNRFRNLRRDTTDGKGPGVIHELNEWMNNYKSRQEAIIKAKYKDLTDDDDVEDAAKATDELNIEMSKMRDNAMERFLKKGPDATSADMRAITSTMTDEFVLVAGPSLFDPFALINDTVKRHELDDALEKSDGVISRPAPIVFQRLMNKYGLTSAPIWDHEKFAFKLTGRVLDEYLSTIGHTTDENGNKITFVWLGTDMQLLDGETAGISKVDREDVSNDVSTGVIKFTSPFNRTGE